MMGYQTISPPGFRASRLRDAQAASRRRRFTWVAVSLSVGAHVAAALLVVLLPHALPRDAPHQGQGTVELLMVEQKGAEPSQAGQPKQAAPTPPPQAAKPTAKDKQVEATAPKPVVAPPISPPGDEAVRPPVEPVPPPPEVTKAEAQPARPPSPQEAKAEPDPARPQEPPVFNLEGTESESNAIVLSGSVLPAMKDDRFRNRPPIYPMEAETRHQSGAVVVVIHVSENGLASAVDVLQSSGVDVLDKAAVAAVQKWRFHPAMKEGRSVPSDMPFRFIFEPY